MFAVRRRKVEEEEKKDVFAPVSDLMVGVVFIFLVMILALSLVMMDDAVPRPDYDQVVRELTETRAKLDAAQKRADQLVISSPISRPRVSFPCSTASRKPTRRAQSFCRRSRKSSTRKG